MHEEGQPGRGLAGPDEEEPAARKRWTGGTVMVSEGEEPDANLFYADLFAAPNPDYHIANPANGSPWAVE